MTKDDFQHLIAGGELAAGNVRLILADIGLHTMSLTIFDAQLSEQNEIGKIRHLDPQRTET